jgi:hypothetical protein
VCTCNARKRPTQRPRPAPPGRLPQVLTIAGVTNGGKTVTVTTDIQYSHYGGEYKAEVALLSRRILFQSDATSVSTGVGPHITSVSPDMRAVGAAFKWLGATNNAGKYPREWSGGARGRWAGRWPAGGGVARGQPRSHSAQAPARARSGALGGAWARRRPVRGLPCVQRGGGGGTLGESTAWRRKRGAHAPRACPRLAPVHYHLAGETTNAYVKDNAFYLSNWRCMTIHGTNGVTVSGNVGFDVKGGAAAAG